MIFLVLAVAAMTWQGVSMEVVVQGLIGTINNLVLLSVPGFIFAGSVMGRGGMAARLINWISAFLGRVPGGMALTTITSAEVFSARSPARAPRPWRRSATCCTRRCFGSATTSASRSG